MARELQKALPDVELRSIAADWRISIRAWLAERKLAKIAKTIAGRKTHDTWQLLKTFCKGHHDKWVANRQAIDKPFQCAAEKCTACGLCEKICPRGNIKRPEGQPVWQHKCVECLGCLHICPARAIDYGEITKERQRYRHKTVKTADLVNAKVQ